MVIYSKLNAFSFENLISVMDDGINNKINWKYLTKLRFNKEEVSDIYSQFNIINYNDYTLINRIYRLKNTFEKYRNTGIIDFYNLKEIDTNYTSFADVDKYGSEEKYYYLPKEIMYLNNLEIFELYENKLQEIPNNLFKLTNLKKLILSENKINNIPSEISKLINLSELWIGDNKIKNIPNELYTLTNLKRLDLSSIKINIISNNISQLINLNDLMLDNNKIESIPDGLYNLINLEYLDLCNNKIKDISNNISKLTNLKDLLLYNNDELKIKIEYLGSLTKLRELKLNEYQVEDVYNSLYNIITYE
jgi:Leucine-rich repeat (LRR) protein